MRSKSTSDGSETTRNGQGNGRNSGKRQGCGSGRQESKAQRNEEGNMITRLVCLALGMIAGYTTTLVIVTLLLERRRNVHQKSETEESDQDGI